MPWQACQDNPILSEKKFLFGFQIWNRLDGMDLEYDTKVITPTIEMVIKFLKKLENEWKLESEKKFSQNKKKIKREL